MKTKLQILLAAFSILFSMASTSAQPVTLDPQTGLPESAPPPAPINPQTGLPERAPLPIDPMTGLPIPPYTDTNGVSTWISPAWKDPNYMVPSVEFLNLPLSEVTRKLQEQSIRALKLEYFDIILPNAPGFDATQIDIDLQLKNVTASEIFSAMNLQFELNKSPYRWELTMNGSRPTALLRVVPELAPAPAQLRKVFFVGNIIDQYPGKDDGAKLDNIEHVIHACTDGTTAVTINKYPPGQLLIVSGTPDEVDLVEQTLRALKDKAEYGKSLQDQHSAKSK